MLQLLNKNNREQNINCINSKVAIVAALEVLGGVIMRIIVTIPIVQEAEAGCERQGRITLNYSSAPNASQERCFDIRTF
jgi:hypothetical protein